MYAYDTDRWYAMGLINADKQKNYTRFRSIQYQFQSIELIECIYSLEKNWQTLLTIKPIRPR